MPEERAIDRLAGLAFAGVVVAILAVGLAAGQDDWHAVLVIVGALLQVTAVLYAARRIWLAPLLSLRPGRATEPERSARELEPSGQERGFFITQEDALVAGGMAIAGILLTLAGNLVA